MHVATRMLSVTLFALVVFAAEEQPLEDVCECECCYELEKGRLECVRSSATTFKSFTCTNCNVSACAMNFPRSCAGKGVSINVKCVERTAWYLRLIPVVFLFATVSLLFYGFFIKTFDGYNPIPDHTDSEDPAFTRTAFSAAPYGSASPSPYQPRHPYAVRRPSLLASTSSIGSVPNASQTLAENLTGTRIQTISTQSSDHGIHLPSDIEPNPYSPIKVSALNAQRRLMSLSSPLVRTRSAPGDYLLRPLYARIQVTEPPDSEMDITKPATSALRAYPPGETRRSNDSTFTTQQQTLQRQASAMKPPRSNHSPATSNESLHKYHSTVFHSEVNGGQVSGDRANHKSTASRDDSVVTSNALIQDVSKQDFAPTVPEQPRNETQGMSCESAKTASESVPSAT